MRRTPALLAAVLVLPSAAPAWAHGELRPDRVRSGVTADLDLVLPSELPGARTTRVVLAMPVGFTARECVEPVGWTCSVAADAVEWRDLARVRAEVDFFFTATVASAPGTYTLPVEQTYDDGTVRTFAGQPGSPDEAPVLTVTGAAPAPTRTDPTATRRPTASPGPGVQTRPSATSAPASAPASTTSSGPGAPSVTRAAAAATTTAFARPSSLPRGERLGDPGGGSRSRTAPILLASVLVALLAAAVLSRRAAR